MGSPNIPIGDSLRLIIGSLRLIIGSQGFPEFDSNKLVSRFRLMGPAEIFDGHAFRQVARVPDLQ
jgi:hypothetical protein